jgi:hypothetical protein
MTINFDFEHEKICPNREATDRSFRSERKRSEHAERLLWEALQPVTCPNCQSHDTHFFDNPTLADPCRVVVWGCKGCGAQFNDFPPRMVYAESIG